MIKKSNECDSSNWARPFLMFISRLISRLRSAEKNWSFAFHAQKLIIQFMRLAKTAFKIVTKLIKSLESGKNNPVRIIKIEKR